MNICFVVNQFDVVGGRQRTARKVMNFVKKCHTIFKLTDDNLFINTDKNIFHILKFLKTNNIELVVLMSSFSVLNIWNRIYHITKIPMIYSEHCSPEYTLKRWSNEDREKIIENSKFIRIHFDSYKEYFPVEYQHKCVAIPNSIQFHNKKSQLKKVVLYTRKDSRWS